jgi:hypothetical protein
MPVGGYWFSSGDGVGRRDELRSSFFFLSGLQDNVVHIHHLKEVISEFGFTIPLCKEILSIETNIKVKFIRRKTNMVYPTLCMSDQFRRTNN